MQLQSLLRAKEEGFGFLVLLIRGASDLECLLVFRTLTNGLLQTTNFGAPQLTLRGGPIDHFNLGLMSCHLEADTVDWHRSE
jgi:hypothetical protein